MAFPPDATVPTTDARSSVEIASPALQPVAPADVDSGADIANRAAGLVAGGGRTASEAELSKALSGNEVAFNALERVYQDPIAAADRLSELGPAERRELSAGNLDVLGELRPDAASPTGGLDRDVVGPGLAAYSQTRSDYGATFTAAEARELDRATGREPGVRPASPETDLEPTRDAGEAPSRSGQGGGLGEHMAGMRNAAQAGAGGVREAKSAEQQLSEKAVHLSTPSL